MHQSGVKTADHELGGLCRDYARMRGREKKTYIIACLSEKYSRSQRTVYRLIRRLERSVDVTGDVSA